MAEDDKPARKHIHDKLDMIRALRQDELERLSRTMAAFPKRDLPARPYTDYERVIIMDEVFTRIEQGESVELICTEPHMPDRGTVMAWLARDVEAGRRYDSLQPARARALFELALWEVQRACDRDSMYIAEKRASMYLRAASLLDPKRYSDKTHAVLGKTQGNQPVSITMHIGMPASQQSQELVVVPTPTHNDE
jgi:hypothetical protein